MNKVHKICNADEFELSSIYNRIIARPINVTTGRRVTLLYLLYMFTSILLLLFIVVVSFKAAILSQRTSITKNYRNTLGNRREAQFN